MGDKSDKKDIYEKYNNIYKNTLETKKKVNEEIKSRSLKEDLNIAAYNSKLDLEHKQREQQKREWFTDIKNDNIKLENEKKIFRREIKRREVLEDNNNMEYLNKHYRRNLL